MKHLLSLLALVPSFVLCSYASDGPQTDLFFGYSFVRYNSAQSVPAFTANGGVETFAWNFNEYIGMEAEVGGYHNGNINNHEFDTTTLSYLFGPRISSQRSGSLVPYFHVLFGGQNAHTSFCCLAPSTGTGTTTASSSLDYSQNNFAMAVGGGLDVKLTKSIMLRPVQLDYLLTRFQAQNFNPNSLCQFLRGRPRTETRTICDMPPASYLTSAGQNNEE